jgi:hypothetical protein
MESDFVLHKRQVPNIEEEIKKIVELSDVGRGWTLVSTTENVNTYTQKSDRSPFHYVLGEGIVHTTTEVILHFLQATTTTTELDPTLMTREEIVRLSETSRVMRLRYKFPPTLSNREFVIHEYDAMISENPKMAVSAGISIEHEMCQEDPQYVRGIILTYGYVCKEITTNPPRTHVSHVIQFDPKGWVPSMVMNVITTGQALNVLRLKKYFENNKAAEQTYKFPLHLLKTIDNSQSEEAETNEVGTSADLTGITRMEWLEDNLTSKNERRMSILNILDSAQDIEAKETLLDSSEPPSAASRFIHFLSSS